MPSISSSTMPVSSPTFTSTQHYSFNGVLFPSHVAQILVCIAYFVAITLTTIMTLQRLPVSLSGFRDMSWARTATVFCMLDSWLFLFISGVLVMGVGLSWDEVACSFGIWLCICSYAASKVFIYLFLMERVHIVTGNGKKRFATWSYRLNIVIMIAWLTVFGLMIYARVTEIRKDGACVIGLRAIATYPLIIQDVCVNVYLALRFMIQIARDEWKNPKLYSLAVRSLFSSVAALVTSLVNMVMLTVLHGHQLGWVCLGSCGLDVFLNAVILYYITSRRANENLDGATFPITRKSYYDKPKQPVFVGYHTQIEVEGLEGQTQKINFSTPGKTSNTDLPMDVEMVEKEPQKSETGLDPENRTMGPFQNSLKVTYYSKGTSDGKI